MGSGLMQLCLLNFFFHSTIFFDLFWLTVVFKICNLKRMEQLIPSYGIILLEMDVFKASIKWLLPSKHGTVDSHR